MPIVVSSSSSCRMHSACSAARTNRVTERAGRACAAGTVRSSCQDYRWKQSEKTTWAHGAPARSTTTRLRTFPSHWTKPGRKSESRSFGLSSPGPSTPTATSPKQRKRSPLRHSSQHSVPADSPSIQPTVPIKSCRHSPPTSECLPPKPWSASRTTSRVSRRTGSPQTMRAHGSQEFGAFAPCSSHRHRRWTSHSSTCRCNALSRLHRLRRKHSS